MKVFSIPTFILLKFLHQGFTFSQSIVLMLFSAVVFATWLKWHTFHMFVLCLAVTFFVISPQEFGTRLVSHVKSVGRAWTDAYAMVKGA